MSETNPYMESYVPLFEEYNRLEDLTTEQRKALEKIGWSVINSIMSPYYEPWETHEYIYGYYDIAKEGGLIRERKSHVEIEEKVVYDE